MEQVRYSVIIPMYNSELYITETIKSVIDQYYESYEIIISDDGSSDNSIQIVNQFNNDKIKLYKNEHLGVSGARNFCLSKASGKYIVFLDSDDKLQKDYFITLDKYINDNLDILVFGYNIFNNDNIVTGENILAPQEDNINNAHSIIININNKNAFNSLWNKVFLLDIIKDNNITMDTSISMGEDLLFILEYLKKCQKNIKVIEESLYSYRINNNGLTSKIKKDYKKVMYKFNKYKDFCIFKSYPKYVYLNKQINCYFNLLNYACDFKENLKHIYSDDIYSDVKTNKKVLSKKNRIFLMVINTKCEFIIKMFLYIFNIMKGRKYDWKN